MSRYDLRDISERLTRSRDTEAVVFECLGYLQALRPDWRASLSFYEVSRDALVSVYERAGHRLKRREVTVPVDQLPPRLVRKFFRPSAFFNVTDRRSLLAHVFQTAPVYEADVLEAPALRGLTPVPNWLSCVCLPLADQEDILALLTIASEKRGAFGGNALGDIVPVKSMAALALSQHLSRAARPATAGDDRTARAAAAEFQDRIRLLHRQAEELREDNHLKARRLEAVMQQIEQLDRGASESRQELDRVKSVMSALEEQSAAATQHLSEAYGQLTQAQDRLVGTQRTVGFLKQAFSLLAESHDDADFARRMVAWLCEQFGIERCSLMVPDPSQESLRIASHRGLDPSVAAGVRVRLGQGIAGWVAHHRQPLFVRMRDEVETYSPSSHDSYNSDSFISVPLVHNNRLTGVLNLSNRSDAEAFDEEDFDRAMLVGSLMAMMLERGAGSSSERGVNSPSERGAIALPDLGSPSLPEPSAA